MTHWHLIYSFCALRIFLALLKNSEVRGDIHGMKVYKGTHPLSHLLFADDCFLFCRSDDNEITTTKEILDKYGEVSRQTINYQKSEIFFNLNIQHPQRQIISSFLHVSKTLDPINIWGFHPS